MFGNNQAGSSRRQFLKQLTAGASAASLGLLSPGAWASEKESASQVETPIGKTSAPKEVVIIGAGLAGLAAAWELEEAGHDVTVLEAKSHPGGRVRTLRDPFADGLYAEAGGVAFSETYEHAKRYIGALGLERTPWAQPELKALYHLKGQRLAVGPDEQPDWPYDLEGEEQGLGPMGLMKKYLFGPLPEEIGTPAAWNAPPLRTLDQVSLADYMRKQGASEGAIGLIADTQFFGSWIERTSTLSSALAEFGLFFGGAPFVLEGGNDRLPKGMAERLSQNVRYGNEVTALRDGGDRVEVEVARGSRTERLEADRAVCTIPPPVLQDTSIEPELPAEKQSALGELPYFEATRTFVQVGRCFWYDEGVAGTAATDLPVSQIYAHPVSEVGGPERRAVLEGYALGQVASRLANRPEAERIEQTLQEMEKVHPKIRDYREGAVVKAWGTDPYQQGHVSWPAPGDVTAHLGALKAPHGRIHFAGEHTSVLRGTMEGALRSGVRAAQEVDEAE